MVTFGKFLKGKNRLHDENPDVRRNAILELIPAKVSELQAELEELAQNDSDTSVRLACVKNLSDANFLGSLLGDSALAQAAAAQIATLINAGVQCRFDTHPLVLGQQLSTATSEREAASLADRIAAENLDQEILLDLLLLCRQDQRELLLKLPSLQSADTLLRLERRSRDHDKLLNRYARGQLEEIKILKNNGTNAQQRAGELADALMKHRKTARNTAFFQRQNILAREFEGTVQTFRECSDLLLARGVALAPISEHEAVFENLDEEPLEEEPLDKKPLNEKMGDQPGIEVPLEDPFPDLTTAFETLHESLLAGSTFADLNQNHKTLTETWLSAADDRPPEPAQHEVFERVSHAFRELADAVERLDRADTLKFAADPIPDPLPTDPSEMMALWQAAGHCRSLLRQAARACKQIAWPTWAKTEPRLDQLLLNIEELNNELHRFDTHEREQVANLDNLIDTLVHEVDAGSTQAASTTLNKARRICKGLPGRSAQKSDKVLNQQAARLAELRDWQTFATAPKREELCHAMQKLAESPLPPSDQAQRIKQLRENWNELGALTKGDDRRLADRFNQFAEQAFKPCRNYFGEQADRRRRNLDQREGICVQLESYLNSSDWDCADMKAAEQIMRAARTEWRKYHPVDRTPGKALEARFEGLQNRLHNLVTTAWEKNLQAKQTIVDEAKSINENTADMGEKVRRAKELQSRWQAVGVTPRRPDQILWREFREYCDQIFASRDNEKQQAEAAIKEALGEAKTICDELAHLLDTTKPSDAESTALRDLQKRFDNLHDLPPRNARSLERRFEQLVGNYRLLLKDKDFEGQFEELHQLKSWDADHAERESAHQAGETTSFESLHPSFADREACLEEDVPLDMLRRLTISAELAAGIETPEEEREVRLEVQVEALKRGLGQRREEDEPMDMVMRWCAAGPKLGGADIDGLRDRFFVAVEKRLRGG